MNTRDYYGVLLRPVRGLRVFVFNPLNLAVFVFYAVGLCLLHPLAAVGQDIKLPPVTRVTLPNGIRLVLMEYRRAPTLTVTALFPGGQCGDPSGKAGTASLTAELLRKGTGKRNAVKIAEEVDFLGASLGTAAGDDVVSVSASALARDTGQILDLFADVILHPTFPIEEIERERQLMLAGLQSLSEDPGAVASRVETEVVYAGHPYGIDATMTSVKSIAREDIAAYHQRIMTPKRMILVAVGDFHTPQFIQALRLKFGDWEKGAESELKIPPVVAGPKKLVLVDKPDATQTQVRFGRTAFARNSKDYFPAEIAETILGGGFTSRLVDEIRINRSLTYGISSIFSAKVHGGSFTVSTFTKIETTRKLLDAVKEVLQKTASTGFTPAEIQKAKNYLSGLYAIHVQTPEALARELAQIALCGLPDDYLQTYLARLRSVTLADANRIVKTYAAPGGLSLVMVAPAKSVDAQLKGLGPIETKPVETIGK